MLIVWPYNYATVSSQTYATNIRLRLGSSVDDVNEERYGLLGKGADLCFCSRTTDECGVVGSVLI